MGKNVPRSPCGPLTFKAGAYIATRVAIKKETNRIKLKLAHVFSDTIFISTSSSPQRTMSLTSHRTPFPSLLYKGPQSCDPQPSSVPRWKAGGWGSGNLLLCNVNETIKFQSPGPLDACRNSSSFFACSLQHSGGGAEWGHGRGLLWGLHTGSREGQSGSRCRDRKQENRGS